MEESAKRSGALKMGAMSGAWVACSKQRLERPLRGTFVFIPGQIVGDALWKAKRGEYEMDAAPLNRLCKERR